MKVDMENTVVGSVVGIIVLLITNIYYVSRFLTKLELKPSEKKVNEMIDDKLKGHCPFADMIESTSGDKLEKIIDNRVDMHPVMREYGITAYRINQLEPDVKGIKADIASIKIAISNIGNHNSG